MRTLTALKGQTKSAVDQCDCEKRTKKREPKPPRTVCKTGTYRQTLRGVQYSPKDEIPCEAPKRKSIARAVKRKLKLKPGQFPTEITNAFHPY